MPEAPVEVAWELAEDEGFARIAASGTFTAIPAHGHTVHAEPTGLAVSIEPEGGVPAPTGAIYLVTQ